LSDNYTNYDYLEIYFRSSTSNDSTFRDIIPISTIAKSSSLATFTIGNNDSSNTRARGLYADTSTSLYITGAYPLSGSSAADNYVIPTKIVGISVSLLPSVGNVKTGVTTVSASETTKVTCGFKPKYICAFTYKTGGTAKIMNVYDEDFSTTKGLYSSTNTSTGYIQEYTLGSSGYYIGSIDNDGFTLSVWPSAWVGPCYYFAIG
jgi:hypothetical protein